MTTQTTPTTTPLAADSTPGACTVRSTTGTAPITFTAVRPAGTVRIDLEDGSSQVYDYRAVSRALFATTAAGPDVLGYGPSLGYEPTTTPTTPRRLARLGARRTTTAPTHPSCTTVPAGPRSLRPAGTSPRRSAPAHGRTASSSCTSRRRDWS